MTRVSVLNDCLNNIVDSFISFITKNFRTMPKRQGRDKYWFDHQAKSSSNSFKSCKSTVPIPFPLCYRIIRVYNWIFHFLFRNVLSFNDPEDYTFRDDLTRLSYSYKTKRLRSRNIFYHNLLIIFRIHRRIWRNWWSSFRKNCHSIEWST